MVLLAAATAGRHPFADAASMRNGKPNIPPRFTACLRDWKRRPIYTAIIQGHADAVKFLITNGASTGCEGGANDAGDDMPSPLILAIRSGQRRIVVILLDSGASVDERERGGMLECPLHAAVRCEDSETLKMLLKKGAKVDCVDSM